MNNPTEQNITNSKFIEGNIKYTLGFHKTKSTPFKDVFLEIKNNLHKQFLYCLNGKNAIIKNREFLEDIIIYKNEILNAIEITEDKNTDPVLKKYIDKPQTNITLEDNDKLIGPLEKQINQQLNDIILDLSDIKEKLKNSEYAMNQFKDLETACNESNSLVKSQIISDLQDTLTGINENHIKDIDYKSIDDIKELPLKEVLDKWNSMIQPSITIVGNMNIAFNVLLYDNEVKRSSQKRKKLKYTLRFFKTVANNLPELVGQIHGFPSLSAIHSDEASFLKKFTGTELKKMSEEHLVKYVNGLYETASKKKPSILDRFKSHIPVSWRQQIPSIIGIIIGIILLIAASLLLVYALDSKEAVHQMLM
ncbi:hypothetical protein NEOKW01_0013 [Nematocida sp. AWRm80]|nr:hypothetical protein NEOKW01_0013 [Nematocida sp. AWRm80]